MLMIIIIIMIRRIMTGNSFHCSCLPLRYCTVKQRGPQNKAVKWHKLPRAKGFAINQEHMVLLRIMMTALSAPCFNKSRLVLLLRHQFFFFLKSISLATNRKCPLLVRETEQVTSRTCDVTNRCICSHIM